MTNTGQTMRSIVVKQICRISKIILKILSHFLQSENNFTVVKTTMLQVYHIFL